jgi:hypothetical protein
MLFDAFRSVNSFMDYHFEGQSLLFPDILDMNSRSQTRVFHLPV